MAPQSLQDERRAAAVPEGGLVTYKQQISFGVHVLAMMAAFYAFGHVAGMAITSNRAAVSCYVALRRAGCWLAGALHAVWEGGRLGCRAAGCCLCCSTLQQHGICHGAFSSPTLPLVPSTIRHQPLLTTQLTPHTAAHPFRCVCSTPPMAYCSTVHGPASFCVQHPFIGLLFMVGALVMETVLFIIRTSVPPKLHLAAARQATAARVARQAQRQQQEAAALQGTAGTAEGAAGSAAAGEGTAARGGRKGGAGQGSQPAKPAAEKKDD